MWMLSFLPDVAFHLLVLLGIFGVVASFVFGFIPVISKYKFPIQVVSILILLFGVYMEGAISNENTWKFKVKELETQIAKKETKSAEATIEIVTQYIDRVKVVKEKSDVIIKEIPKYITKEVDAQCSIPESIRMLHTAASKNEVPDSSSDVDGTSTKTTTGP